MSYLNFALDPEKLTELISLLKSIQSTGYSLGSSPADILLDILIDITWLLSRIYGEGARGQSLNEGVGFSDIFQDVLGNPKQFKIHFESKLYWDPKVSIFMKELTQAFVLLKKGKTFQKSFDRILKICYFKPPDMSLHRDTFARLTERVRILEQETKAQKKQINALLGRRRLRKTHT